MPSPAKPTYEELTQRAIDGDIDALTLLIEHPKTQILLDKVSSRASAKYKLDKDDVRGFILLKVFNGIETLTMPAQLAKWCHFTAKRYCLNQVRHSMVESRYRELELAEQGGRFGKRRGASLATTQVAPSPEEELLIKEQQLMMREMARRAIRASPPLSEKIFVSWANGQTLRQISEETGMPLRTVQRILKNIQKSIITESLSEIESIRGRTKSSQSKIEKEKRITRKILEGLHSK